MKKHIEFSEKHLQDFDITDDENKFIDIGGDKFRLYSTHKNCSKLEVKSDLYLKIFTMIENENDAKTNGCMPRYNLVVHISHRLDGVGAKCTLASEPFHSKDIDNFQNYFEVLFKKYLEKYHFGAASKGIINDIVSTLEWFETYLTLDLIKLDDF
jgi:hypothetical protein